MFTLIVRPVRCKRKGEDLMEQNLSAGPKKLAEICGGVLTWVGTAMIILPLVWWATRFLRLANINWQAALVWSIGAPISYLITGLIERWRSDPNKAPRVSQPRVPRNSRAMLLRKVNSAG